MRRATAVGLGSAWQCQVRQMVMPLWTATVDCYCGLLLWTATVDFYGGSGNGPFGESLKEQCSATF